MKKQIKGSITVTDNVNGRSHVYSRKQINRATQRFKTRIAAGGLAAGIAIGAATTTFISKFANDMNKTAKTEEAIVLALEANEYQNRLKENPMLQQVVEQEGIIKIEDLSSAITTYKELQYKSDRTFSEEKQYIMACETIVNSKEIVENLYRETIKAKVATAYRITDPEQIAKIEINDYIKYTSPSTVQHNPEIVLPDGTVIGTSRSLFSEAKIMDTALAKQICQVSAISKVSGNQDTNMYIEQVETVIETLEELMNFDKNYKVSLNKNEDIETTVAQPEKEISKEENEHEER